MTIHSTLQDTQTLIAQTLMAGRNEPTATISLLFH